MYCSYMHQQYVLHLGCYYLVRYLRHLTQGVFPGKRQLLAAFQPLPGPVLYSISSNVRPRKKLCLASCNWDIYNMLRDSCLIFEYVILIFLKLPKWWLVIKYLYLKWIIIFSSFSHGLFSFLLSHSLPLL